MQRKNNSLVPVYDSDLNKIMKIKEGKTVSAEIKQQRNLLHHRKFFAILNLVCDNSDKWERPEQLLIALKIKMGYVNIVPDFNGGEIIAPGSIRFEVMSQDKFSEFYDVAMRILAKEIGVSVADLEENHINYL